ncbi:MAG: MerR family transcriptional regulator [Chthonomonadales bacterium]|nr:MerR family transcriptional regulator [Chthonomonadales bacterium]
MPTARKRAGRALSIGAVSALTGIEIHTLRYWEREFAEFVCPSRTPGGQRRYDAEDIATLIEIRRLLKQEIYSIAGARRVLAIIGGRDTERRAA